MLGKRAKKVKGCVRGNGDVLAMLKVRTSEGQGSSRTGVIEAELK